jgi:hypothetical protein
VQVDQETGGRIRDSTTFCSGITKKPSFYFSCKRLGEHRGTAKKLAQGAKESASLGFGIMGTSRFIDDILWNEKGFIEIGGIIGGKVHIGSFV